MGKKLWIPPCTPPKEIKLIGAFGEPEILFLRDYDCTLDPIHPAGYETHKNPDTGEPLPNCCEHHQQAYSLAKEWYEKFPACCKYHQKMAENEWFNKCNYSFLPGKIVQQLSLTEHLIRKKIDSSNWLDSISGYINHNFLCFGIYGIGLNIYLESLERFINSPDSSIPREKAIKLTEHIRYAGKHYKYDKINTRDWGYMPPIIQRWIELFPFKLTVPTDQISSMQILEVPTPYDTYTERFALTGVQYAIDEKEQVTFVSELTRKILGSVRQSGFFQDGALKDPDRAKLELANKKIELATEKIAIDFDKRNQSHAYFGLLEQWYLAADEYLDTIRELKKANSKLFPEEKPRPRLTEKELEAAEGFGINPNIVESEPASLEQTKIKNRKIIETYFGAMEGKWGKGWEYAFKNHSDYKIVVDLLEKFFSETPCEVPIQPIITKPNSKTKLAQALGSMHLGVNRKLNKDKKFLEIVRAAFEVFSKVKDEILYNDLSRNRGLI